MKQHTGWTLLLWALVILGFLGAAKISYENFTGSACPHLFMIPMCYVVLLAYALMLGALIINQSSCRHHFFGAGWGLAFMIALFASIAELTMGGGICPVSNSASLRGSLSTTGVPMCYVSLVMLVVILVLFIRGPYRRTCELHNSRPMD